MEYKIDCIIEFFAWDKLKLHKRLEFTLPCGASVGLVSTHDNNITGEIFLEALTRDDAKARAEHELRKICHLLSYFYNIPIPVGAIKGVVPVNLNPEDEQESSTQCLAIDTILSRIQELEERKVDKLACYLEKDYPPDFEVIVSMWKEAISTESSILSYYLLYRLIEYLFKSDTRKITKWIISKEPSVKIIPSDRQKKHNVTLYTSLRNNIHPINKEEFPFEDIKCALPKLQNLTKQAIEEKFNSLDEE